MTVSSVKKSSGAVKKPSLQEKRPETYVVKSGDNVSTLAKRYNMTIEQFMNFAGLKSAKLIAGDKIKFQMTSIPEGRGLGYIVNKNNMDKKAFCKLNGIVNYDEYKPKAGEKFYVLEGLGKQTGKVKAREQEEPKIPTKTVEVVSSDSSQKVEKNTASTPIQDKKSSTLKKNERIEKHIKYTEYEGVYTVVSGDRYYNIAKKLGVSQDELEKANQAIKTLHPGDKLNIPTSKRLLIQEMKDFKAVQDALSAYMKISPKFLADLKAQEDGFDNVNLFKNPSYNYPDDPTLGIGHSIKKKDFDLIYVSKNPHITLKNNDAITIPLIPTKYKGQNALKVTDDSDITKIFADDMLSKYFALQKSIGKEDLEAMPQEIREAILDVAFNAGEGAVNSDMIAAIKNGEYNKVIKGISKVTVEHNNRVQSGLYSRRLYEMSIATKYYKGKVPPDVIDTVKKFYIKGLSEQNNKADYAAKATKYFEAAGVQIDFQKLNN